MSYDTLPPIGEEKQRLTSHAFEADTNGSEVAQVFAEQVKEKNIVITGVSPKSLGESLAINIANFCPRSLILASRTRSKLETVGALVKEKSGFVPTLVELDLSSRESIQTATSRIFKEVDHINILINNAAVVSSERRETKDGLEQTFGTNHIGHFLLVQLLLPLLLASTSRSRIVNVTSLGYRLSPIRFHDYNFEGKAVPPEEEPPKELPPHMKPDMSQNRPYQGFCAYGQSKTANILHCVSLNKRYGRQGLRAFAVHPGSIWTDLSRNLTPDDLKIIEGTSTSWLTQDQGTATILVAALDPKLANVTDEVFLSDCKFTAVAETAKNLDIAERLWTLSESLTTYTAKI